MLSQQDDSNHITPNCIIYSNIFCKYFNFNLTFSYSEELFQGGVDWKSFRNNYVPIELPQLRIIGGDEAVPHSYPFVVGLVINENAFCGGTLLTKNYVLTAAHCAVA